MKFETHEAVYEFVKTIPRGKVMSYGAVGRCIGLTGRQVGRVMAMMDAQDIPWWRVLGHDGTFSIAKMNPILAIEQRDRLLAEGVPIKNNGKADMRAALWLGDSEES